VATETADPPFVVAEQEIIGHDHVLHALIVQEIAFSFASLCMAVIVSSA
jgi:hypothetical protein